MLYKTLLRYLNFVGRYCRTTRSKGVSPGECNFKHGTPIRFQFVLCTYRNSVGSCLFTNFVVNLEQSNFFKNTFL